VANNIYDILNRGKFDFDEYEAEDFNDIEMKMLKKNITKSINGKRHSSRICASACVVIVIMGIAIMSFGATRAYAISRVDLIGESISSFLGIGKNLSSYNTVVNKSVTDNGVTVTLNEVLLDGDELVVSSNISSDRVLKENDTWDSDMHLYINDKRVRVDGARGGSKNIDSSTTQQVMKYDLSAMKNIDLKGNLNIKIMYSDMMVNMSDNKYGTWKFEFKTNGDQLKKDTNTINIDKKFVIGNGNEYIVKKYTSNDLGQKMYGSIVNNSTKNETYNVCVKGHDDLGNDVEFSLVKGTKNSFVLQYQNVLDGNINKEASKLTLNFYAVKMPEKSGKEPDISQYKKVGEEFTVNIK